MKWRGLVKGMIILYAFLIITIECKTSAMSPEISERAAYSDVQGSEAKVSNTERTLTNTSIDDKIEKRIKLFMGDLDKGQIVYEDYTSDQGDEEADIDFLTRVLKLYPQKTGTYIIGIPHAGAIKAVEIDLNDHKVCINMTKEYDLKQYGSLGEYLALQSVANTAANYYQVNKVVIEIEGQPYRSGHYTFEENEEIDLVQLNEQNDDIKD
jgi:hypothetical protein